MAWRWFGVANRRIQIVEVVWHDITGHGPEWQSLDELEAAEHAECRSVGYLWARGKNLKIVGTITKDCGFGDINVIPVGCVVSVTVLRTVTVNYVKAAKAV